MKISGSVKTEAGELLSGVRVTGTIEEIEVFETESNQHGEFSFQDHRTHLTGRTINLRAEHHRLNSQEITRKVPQDELKVNFVLSGLRVFGSVRENQSHKPLSGTTVKLFEGGRELFVGNTGNEGEFSFKDERGLLVVGQSLIIRIEKTGYQPQERHEQLLPSGELKPAFELSRLAFAIAGTVRDGKTGEPLKGALVTVVSGSLQELFRGETGSGGEFHFANQSGLSIVGESLTVQVQYRGYESQQQRGVLPATGELHLVFELPRRLRAIEGIVRDRENERALNGVIVEILSGGRQMFKGESNREGKFVVRIEEEVVSRHLTFRLSRRSYEPLNKSEEMGDDDLALTFELCRKPIPPFWRKLPYAVASVLLLISLIAGARHFFVLVPNVVGNRFDEAESRLRAAGLKIGPEVHKPAPDRREGIVILTSPTAHWPAWKGTAVILTVSAPPPPVELPNVVGLPSQEAAAKLAELGLKSTSTPEQSDKTSGTVVEMFPSAHSPVSKDTRITLMIASPIPVMVPDVRDMKIDEAKERLKVEKLAVGQVFTLQTDDPQQPPDSVWKTAPEAGKPVVKGTTVDLTIAASVTVPDVVHKKFADAVKQLKAAGLRCRKVLKANNDVLPVSASSPPKGARVLKGSWVELTVATIPPPPPATPSPMVVPSIPVGSNLNQARNILTNAGLGIGLPINYMPTKNQPPGTVLSTNPPAGQRAPTSGLVSLTIAETNPMVFKAFVSCLRGQRLTLWGAALGNGGEMHLDGPPGESFDVAARWSTNGMMPSASFNIPENVPMWSLLTITAKVNGREENFGKIFIMKPALIPSNVGPPNCAYCPPEVHHLGLCF